MMNENVKKYWLPALRSGKYKQVTGKLGGDRDGYCCLGIACKAFEEVKGESFEKDNNGDYAANFLEDDFDIVRKWLGLKNDVGSYIDCHNQKNCLAAHNDNGESFDSIADIIEKNQDTLFE